MRDRATAEGRRGNRFEVHRFDEDALAVPEHYWMDEEADFIDESGSAQGPSEAGTTVRQ